MGCLCFGNSSPAEPTSPKPPSASATSPTGLGTATAVQRQTQYQVASPPPPAPKPQPEAKETPSASSPALCAESADLSYQAAAIPPWQKETIINSRSSGIASGVSGPERLEGTPTKNMPGTNLAEILRLNLGEVSRMRNDIFHTGDVFLHFVLAQVWSFGNECSVTRVFLFRRLSLSSKSLHHSTQHQL